MLFDEIKDAFKHSVVYGGGAAIRNAMALLLIPLYGTFLTETEYGIFEVLEATARFLLVVLEMQMGSAYILAVMYEEKADRQTVVSTAFSFLAISAFIMTAILIGASRPLSALLLGNTQYRPLVAMVLLMVFFQVFRTVALARLRAEKQSKLYSGLVGTTAALQVGFCFVALAVLRKGLAGAVAANTIAAAVVVILYLVTIKSDLVRRFSTSCLKSMLKFGVPLVPAALAATALTFSDRYFLRLFRSFGEVGLYGMGYRFGMVMGLAVAAVQMAWPPVVYEAAKRDDASKFYALFLTYFFFALCFLALGLILFSPDIIHAILPRWTAAIPVVPWIVVSYIFWGIQAVTNVGVCLKKKTHHLALVIVAGAGLNLLLNWFLIPNYGVIGAAAATLVSYAVIAAAAVAVSLRLYPIKYEYGRLLKIALVACLLASVAFPATKLGNVGLGIAVKAACLLLFPFALYAIRFYTVDELSYVRNWLFAFRAPRK